jgi:hypothetical protein
MNLHNFKRKQNSNNLFSFVNSCLLNIDIIKSIDELNEFMPFKGNSLYNILEIENNEDIFSFHGEVDYTPVPAIPVVPVIPAIPVVPVIPAISPVPVYNKSIIYPKHKNSLFWSIYISIYGYNDYLMIGNKFTNKELEEQQKIMQYIKENNHEMKCLKMKITNSLLQQIMSDLMINNITTNHSLLNAFSVYYKSNIYILNQTNYTYLVFGNKNNDYNSNSIIIQYNENKYGLNTNIEINDIDNSYLFLENIEKPLKSVSNYKLSELKTLYIKFNNFNKNKYEFEINKQKKQELYDLLSQLCTWKINK